MTPILEEAALGSDLDCQNFDLRNIGHMYPVPVGLVDKNDPTLYDPRVPPFASVTNDSVSPVAEISQSKLNLNDVIPPAWLATDGAAKGSSSEFRSRKGTPNGYAALDAAGKLLSSNVTAGAGLGTVTSVALLLPPELAETPPITDSGAFSPQWNDVPDGSWFGVHEPELPSEDVQGALYSSRNLWHEQGAVSKSVFRRTQRGTRSNVPAIPSGSGESR